MASLSLEGITKSFGAVSVIKGVDLSVGDGEFVVFVGPSGCGKSTLLRMIAGLETQTEGRIVIGGRDVQNLTPGERGIAMVFQSYALYPHMTVAQNLAFGLENTRADRATIEAKVQDAARILAMEPYLSRRPRELSGGQRQRVAIGRAIVRDPDVFLFDEPLSNLDAALRVNTRAEITRLHRRLKATMIYVTHDQIEAMTMADRIAVLNAGRVEQFGTPEDLFQRPANKFVATFIGSPRMNVFPGTVQGSVPGGIALNVPGFGPLVLPFDGAGLQPGAGVEIGIRPQHLKPAASGASFVVDYSEGLGTETFVYGTINGTAGDVILHLPDHLSFVSGEVVPVAAEPGRVHLFDAETGLSVPRLAT